MRYLTGEQQGTRGRRLFVQSWLPDGDARAVVVLVHGLGEHSGRYDELVRRLVGRGIAVHSLDLRGHGRSSGARAHIGRFAWLVADVAGRLASARAQHTGRPAYLLGHSMGGAIALAVALEHPELVDGLILSAPAVGADPNLPRARLLVARLLSIVAPTVGALRLRAEALSHDPIVVRGYQNDPLVFHGSIPARTLVELLDAMQMLKERAAEVSAPVLILHGTEDELAPLAFAEPVYARLGSRDVTIRRYAGFYHELFNEPARAEVFADLDAWLDQHVP